MREPSNQASPDILSGTGPAMHDPVVWNSDTTHLAARIVAGAGGSSSDS
jgi:hypothetical protein